ncbi:MAG: hypothetical protein R2827_16570 [Bdellovibrionales bacterium]
MSDPIWLVRTGGMIIGPFTREQVGERIKTREITGLDELLFHSRAGSPFVKLKYLKII